MKLITVRLLEDGRWQVKHGKSWWVFSLPQEREQFNAQMKELTDWGSRVQSES